MRRPTLTLVKPSPTGVVTGPFQGDAVAPDRVEERGRQRLAGALDGGDAGVVAIPLDVDARAVENADDGGGDFRADSVTGDERNGVRHQCVPV